MLEVIQSTIFEHGIRMWQSSRGATEGAGGGTVVGVGGGTAAGATVATEAAGKAVGVTKAAGGVAVVAGLEFEFGELWL
jgi:hypothetical protein